jgi:O-antigen/teichoic acid export membrane protein
MMQKIHKLIKSNSFQTLSIFAGGNILVSVLGGLGGILQSRWVAPEVFGEFRKYAILSGYLNIGLITVQDALMRQYPYLIGKGDKEEALKVVSAAKWWYMMLSYFFSTLFIALTVMSMLRGDFRAAMGWSVQIAVVWTSFYGVYLGVMYRTSQDFKRLTYNSMFSTIMGLFLLVGVKLWGYWGVALRNALQLLTSLWLNHKYMPVRVKGSFDRKRLIQLAKMSLPISVPGYVSTSLTGATISMVILNYLGHTELGVYSLALTLQGMAMVVTLAIGQMFYPKIMCKFGACEDYRASIEYTIKPTCFSLFISLGIVVVLCLTVGPFIKFVIPKYIMLFQLFVFCRLISCLRQLNCRLWFLFLLFNIERLYCYRLSVLRAALY